MEMPEQFQIIQTFGKYQFEKGGKGNMLPDSAFTGQSARPALTDTGGSRRRKPGAVRGRVWVYPW